MIIFFNTIKDLYLSSFASYTADKVIKGYFPNLCDITILGAADGLKGFKIKNSVQYNGQWHDSRIRYNEQHGIYAGHNITFNKPNVETIEIDDQLKRHDNKDDIHQSDVEFHNLMEKISDLRQPSEIARATSLLLKFGGLRQKKMEQEQNHFKKRSFPKFILPFYRRAIEIGSPLFDTTPIKKVIDELEKSIIEPKCTP